MFSANDAGTIELDLSSINLTEYDSLAIEYDLVTNGGVYSPSSSYYNGSISWTMFPAGTAPNENETVYAEMMAEQTNITSIVNDHVRSTNIISPTNGPITLVTFSDYWGVAWVGGSTIEISAPDAIEVYCMDQYPSSIPDFAACVSDFPEIPAQIDLNLQNLTITGYKTDLLNSLNETTSENVVLLGSYDILGQEVTEHTLGIIIEHYSDGSTVRLFRK
jgi:hypothetical protein